MIRALLLSFNQLTDPPILRVLIKTLLLTLVLLLLLGGGVWYGLDLAGRQITTSSSVDLLAGVAAIPLTLGLGWIGFRAIAVGVLQLFGDDIVIAVERRYYPDASARARHVPAGMALRLGVGSAVRALLVNLLALPLYLVLLITGVGTPILFLAINAWLLGHDLTDLAGARHLDHPALVAWKRAHRSDRLLLGAIVAALFLVPFVNLVAPVVGAAMATHLFHGNRAR